MKRATKETQSEFVYFFSYIQWLYAKRSSLAYKHLAMIYTIAASCLFHPNFLPIFWSFCAKVDCFWMDWDFWRSHSTCTVITNVLLFHCERMGTEMTVGAWWSYEASTWSFATDAQYSSEELNTAMAFVDKRPSNGTSDQCLAWSYLHETRA